jgi:hypothetical protein
MSFIIPVFLGLGFFGIFYKKEIFSFISLIIKYYNSDGSKKINREIQEKYKDL